MLRQKFVLVLYFQTATYCYLAAFVPYFFKLPEMAFNTYQVVGHVHKYQLDFSPIVEIWYECYKITCDISKVNL